MFCIFFATQGICPGNRLKVLSAYSGSTTSSGYSTASPLSSSPCPPIINNNSANTVFYSNSYIPSTADLYENNATIQKHGKRRSWHIMPNKVCDSLWIYCCTQSKNEMLLNAFCGIYEFSFASTIFRFRLEKRLIKVDFEFSGFTFKN